MNRISHGLLPSSVLLCLLLAPACGSSAPAPSDPSAVAAGQGAALPPPQPVELLPADVFLVLRADMSKLRQSPYWPTIEGWIAQMQQAADRAGESSGAMESLAAVLDRTDEILVALAPSERPGGEPHTLVIASGAYQPGELQDYLAEQARRRGHTEPPRIEAREGRDVIVAGDAAGVDVDGNMWIAGSPGRVDEMLSRLERRAGASPMASDRFRAMAERVSFDDASLAVVAEGTPEVREMLRRRVPGTAQPLVGSLLSFGMRLEIDSGIDLSAIVVTDDPAVAEGLAVYVQRMIGRVDGNMFVRMLGAQGIIDATTVSAQGPEARLVVAADHETTANALDRLGNFIGMALSAMVTGQGEMPSMPGMDGAEGGDAP